MLFLNPSWTHEPVAIAVDQKLRSLQHQMIKSIFQSFNCNSSSNCDRIPASISKLRHNDSNEAV
ncbi:hypothetical protein [Nostoc sp.]|uniref:hypothetical protein n=1 Tax=Nostoc sp. TaxID=1180 RepID=UPI002FFC435B